MRNETFTFVANQSIQNVLKRKCHLCTFDKIPNIQTVAIATPIVLDDDAIIVAEIYSHLLLPVKHRKDISEPPSVH